MKVTMLPRYILKTWISIVIRETNQNNIPEGLIIFPEHVQHKKQKTVTEIPEFLTFKKKFRHFLIFHNSLPAAIRVIIRKTSFADRADTPGYQCTPY